MREHIFKHSFQDTLNPLCDCDMGVKSLIHFLLQCALFLNKRGTLMSNLNKTDPKRSKFNLSNPTNTFFFRKSSFSNKINILMLNAITDYILSTRRLDKPLFLIKYVVINPFSVNVVLPYSLKTSENSGFQMF